MENNEDNTTTDFTKKIKFLNFINKLDENNFHKLITLIKLIKKRYSELTIAIKTPNPSYDRRWGDYFFAISLKKSLEKKGFNVVIHERDNWNNDDFDIAIVLRGLIKYDTNPFHLNLMWNISHPNIIPLSEYETYDIVFVASNKYAENLSNKVNTLIYPLLQCTDPNKFRYEKNNEFHDEILFVGFSKGKVSRKIIRDILKTPHDFSVYGFGWEEFIDKKYIKGQFIDNNILNKAYSNCKILLNDHWEDMVEKDFVSNRIYDALACKTFVISDYVESIHSLFNGAVVTYNTPQDLNEKLDYYLNHDAERTFLANKGYEIVLKNHTFDNRVFEIFDFIEKTYYFKFIKQIENNHCIFFSQNRVSSSDLLHDFLNRNANDIVSENKAMNIKISKLEEKIYFLEKEKLFNHKKIKKNNKNHSFFKFF